MIGIIMKQYTGYIKMIKNKTRDVIDELMYDFKDEYDRIAVDIPFCINQLKGIIEILKDEVKGMSWLEAHGITVIKNDL